MDSLAQFDIERRNSFRLSYTFFYCSMLIGLFCMVGLTSDIVKDITFPNYVWLDKITYYADPLIILFISCCITAYIAAQYFAYRPKSFKKLKASHPKANRLYLWFFFLLITFSIVFFAEFLSDLLKHAFDYSRLPIGDQKGEPFLMGAITGQLRLGNTACPSGSAIRQLFTLMTFILFLNQNLGTIFQNKMRKRFENESLKIDKLYKLHIRLFIVQLLFFLFVCFSRVYRGQHTFFDIGVSLGVGIYVYWLTSTVVLFLIIKKASIKTKLFMTDISYVSFIFLPLFFFYSRSAIVWTIGSAGIILTLCLIYLLYENDKDKKSIDKGISHDRGTRSFNS